MTEPGVAGLFAALDATWPAASSSRSGPFTLRAGHGGGSRVSAATLDHGPADDGTINEAATAMMRMGQIPLFMVRAGEDALDAGLAATGYAIKDPVIALAAPLTVLTIQRPPPVTSFEVWPPLACQRDIWAEGGIGPARLAIMDRVTTPKTSLLGRSEDTPAGTAFVACHGPTAMVHALEILPRFRRRGLGRHLMTAAAFWAEGAGATRLVVLCTRANDAAVSLYTSMGFAPVGSYHYRIQKDR